MSFKPGSGAMIGGAMQGLMGAVQLYQNQQRLNMEEERNDRANKLLDFQIGKAQRDQEADQAMAGISEREAQDTSLGANRDALNDQAKANLALNDQLDTTDGAPSAAEQVANQSISEAESNGNTLSDTDKANIRRAWGVGLKPDDVRAYDYNLQRAAVYRSKGDWKTAKELEDQAHSDAAGSFINAIMNRDKVKTADLYNVFPNGHQVNDLDFDKDGGIIVRDGSGVRKVSQYDAISGAMAQMKPEAAANMAVNKFRNDEQYARLIESLNARAQQSDNSNLTRLTETLLRQQGGGGSKAGSGSGLGGSGGSQMKYSDFTESMKNPETGKLDGSADQAWMVYNQLKEKNPDQFSGSAGDSEAAFLAKQVARGQAAQVPDVSPDGSWSWGIRDKNNNFYPVQRNINPAGLSSNDGKPLLTADQIKIKEVESLTKFKASNPDQFGQIASNVLNNDRWNTLLAARDRATDPTQRAELNRAVNFGQMIRKYGVPSLQTVGGTPYPSSQATPASDTGTSVYSGANPLKFIPGLNMFTGGLMPRSSDDLSGTPYGAK